VDFFAIFFLTIIVSTNIVVKVVMFAMNLQMYKLCM